jgi:hypothetical protein
MKTIIVHPENKDPSKILEAFLKSLGFKFEIDTKSTFSKDFAEMVEKRERNS